MSIQFRCSECRQMLRVPDGTAGRQAKCPQCEALMTIPPASETDDAAPLPGEPAAPPSAFPAMSETPAPQPAEPKAELFPSPVREPTPPPAEESRPFSSGVVPPVRYDVFEDSNATPNTSANAFTAPSAAPSETGNPYQSPVDHGTPIQQSIAEAKERIKPTNVPLGDLLGKTWAILKNRYGITLGVVALAWLGIMAAAFVIYIVAIVIIGFAVFAVLAGSRSPEAILGVVIPGALAIYLAIIGASSYFHAGGLKCMFDIARGRPVDISEVFKGFSKWGRVFLVEVIALVATFVSSILIAAPVAFVIAYAIEAEPTETLVAVLLASLWGFLCLAGLVVFLTTYMHAIPAIVDQDLPLTKAMGVSREITRGNRWKLLVVGLLVACVLYVPPLLVVGGCVAMFGFEAGWLIGNLFFYAWGFLATILLVWPFIGVFTASSYLQMSGQPLATGPYNPYQQRVQSGYVPGQFGPPPMNPPPGRPF